MRHRWLVLAFLLGWAQGLALAAQTCGPIDRSGSSPLYVVRRGWHIDVAFAAADLEAPLRTLLAKFPGARYVTFGFGDRRYLMAQHRGVPAMLQALWPGPGLLLVTGLRATPADAFGAANVISVPRSRQQLAAAQGFIWQSLARSGHAILASASSASKASRTGETSTDASAENEPSDNLDPVQPPDELALGPYAGSLYFSSRLNYSGLHTCNTWAAETLHHANLPVRPYGVFFAGQVWKRSLKFAAAE